MLALFCPPIESLFTYLPKKIASKRDHGKRHTGAKPMGESTIKAEIEEWNFQNDGGDSRGLTFF
jgi:hypothetical protein